MSNHWMWKRLALEVALQHDNYGFSWGELTGLLNGHSQVGSDEARREKTFATNVAPFPPVDVAESSQKTSLEVSNKQASNF